MGNPIASGGGHHRAKLSETRSRGGSRSPSQHRPLSISSLLLSLVLIVWFLFSSEPSPCHARVVVHPTDPDAGAWTASNHTCTTSSTNTNNANMTGPNNNSSSSCSSSSSWISFAAPTWVYLSPSVAGYNITAPLVRVDIQVIEQLDPYRNMVQGNILWVPNYHSCRIYLETLIHTCISYGCVAAMFSSSDYPHSPGVFRFADGSASRSGGSGLTIPLINICEDDALVLNNMMTSHSGSTIVTITDGDENPPFHEFYLPLWTWIGIIQIICAATLWALATHRLFQWYRHWRITRQVSHVAVVSLLIEFVATGIRCAAPQPEENITGKYHFYLVHGCNLAQLGITGIVDILIVCYFADTIHQSNGASTLGSKSSTFVTRNRGSFFAICVVFCALLGICISLGVGLYITPDELFMILRVSYAVVMIACTILLSIMVTKVRATLASVLDIIQPAQRKPFQARITRITTRVLASMLGMVSTIGMALIYMITSPNSIRTESIWAAILFAGANLSSLAHIETFHCPPRPSSSVSPSAPPTAFQLSSKRDRERDRERDRDRDPSNNTKPVVHNTTIHHTSPHGPGQVQTGGNMCMTHATTEYQLLHSPETQQESAAGQENSPTIIIQHQGSRQAQQQHMPQQQAPTPTPTPTPAPTQNLATGHVAAHPGLIRLHVHSVEPDKP